jgi:hypothetical protein
MPQAIFSNLQIKCFWYLPLSALKINMFLIKPTRNNDKIKLLQKPDINICIKLLRSTIYRLFLSFQLQATYYGTIKQGCFPQLMSADRSISFRDARVENSVLTEMTSLSSARSSWSPQPLNHNPNTLHLLWSFLLSHMATVTQYLCSNSLHKTTLCLENVIQRTNVKRMKVSYCDFR